MITWLKQEYKSILEYRPGEMSDHQGNINNYLRMTLYYTEGGNVKVRMIYYINEIISASNKEYPRGSGIKTSAALEDLYKVDEDCEKLIPDKDVT